MNCRHAILQRSIWFSLLLIACTAQAQQGGQGGSPSEGGLTLVQGEHAPKGVPNQAPASQATWIWYPGDFEIWLANKMQNRRTERGSFFPPFWKLDGHYVLMDFHKDVELTEPEQIDVFVEGNYILKLDGKGYEGTPQQVTIPAGKHRINVKVFSTGNVPSIYIKGKTIATDSSWLVTFEDKEWIDETGKTSDISATTWLNAGSWNFNDPAQRPSQFKLAVKPQSPVAATKIMARCWLILVKKHSDISACMVYRVMVKYRCIMANQKKKPWLPVPAKPSTG